MRFVQKKMEGGSFEEAAAAEARLPAISKRQRRIAQQ